jgi:hypothetical protein
MVIPAQAEIQALHNQMNLLDLWFNVQQFFRLTELSLKLGGILS